MEDYAMNLDEFQDKLRSLSWQDFESFVVDILRSTGRFSDIAQSVLIDGGAGLKRQFDIVAVESNPIASTPRNWFFEVKKRNFISVDVIDSLIGKYQDIPQSDGPVHLVLVTSGNVTKAAHHRSQNYGVEVWDSVKLASLVTPEIIETYFGERAKIPKVIDQENQKSDVLLEALRNTTPGKESWSVYQRLSSEIFEYLFCPPLEPPRYNVPDSDSQNIRDMIFENSTMTGFWALVRITYAAQYIVVDAKNYSAPIKKRPVLDIAHYLKSYGCGLFGVLLTRKGAGLDAKHTIREQWIGANKMIVVLSDTDIEELLTIKASGGRPEELIRKKIADFRMSL
jgi:hypothetical protein